MLYCLCKACSVGGLQSLLESFHLKTLQTLSFFVTCRFAVVLQHFTQNQLVGVFAEWITEHGSRDQIHVAVGALSLVGTGAIKVPLRQIYKRKGADVITLYTAYIIRKRFSKNQEDAYLQCFWAQNPASWFCTVAPLRFHQSKCTWPGLYPPVGGPCTAVSQLYSGWHWRTWPSFFISYYNTPENKKSKGQEMRCKSGDHGALWITCCETGVGGKRKGRKKITFFF